MELKQRTAFRIVAGVCFAVLACALITATIAQEKSDTKRGAQLYRECAACHSLQPGLHLSGPSLFGAVGRKAGSAPSFQRYSPGMKSAEFTWDDVTLNAWLADPPVMIPGTFMFFRGISDEQQRADLIAFLKVATAPGGAEAVVTQKLISADIAMGQQPEPLGSLSPAKQVSQVRHCGDTYFVTTANGVETPFWEMNVRLKLDTRNTGPAAGKPAVVGAGMTGDRVSIIFANLSDLTKFVFEKC